jgi:hypothetical protein
MAGRKHKLAHTTSIRSRGFVIAAGKQKGALVCQRALVSKIQFWI